MNSLIQHADAINRLMARNGVRFGIGKDGKFEERLFPFDPLPRIITAAEWKTLERGLAQRVDALNHYLIDIYHDKRIVADGVVPGEFAFSSSGYLGPCEGITPPKGIMSHISGIDLVQARNGDWFVLEDNLRIPSGASYPLIARICFEEQLLDDVAHHRAPAPMRHHHRVLLHPSLLSPLAQLLTCVHQL